MFRRLRFGQVLWLVFWSLMLTINGLAALFGLLHGMYTFKTFFNLACAIMSVGFMIYNVREINRLRRAEIKAANAV